MGWANLKDLGRAWLLFRGVDTKRSTLPASSSLKLPSGLASLTVIEALGFVRGRLYGIFRNTD